MYRDRISPLPPPPWSVDEFGAAYVVKDNNGQKLAHVYYEEEPGRRSSAKLLTKDEARRIAANFAKLRSYCRSPEVVLGDAEHHDATDATWDFLRSRDRIHSLQLHPHAKADKKAGK